MKTKIFTLTMAIVSLFTTQTSKAQTTAMNFNIMDCNGNGPHNLFNDLDAGKVVIIEYFMTSCSPCVTAGQTLESMKSNLLSQYPGKIKAYAFAYNNSYSCSTVNSWVTTNSITSIPSDSGATQVAYYGGMGMPTIVIAGGSNHNLLGSPYIGFAISDTTTMANDIRNFLNSPTGLKENKSSISSSNVYPNPASSEIKIDLTINESTDLKIDIIDVTGRVVARLYNEKAFAGNFTRTFNTTSLSQGNYILRVNSSGTLINHKLNIVK